MTIERSQVEQFSDIEQGAVLTVTLDDTLDTDVPGSTVWRRRLDDSGLDRPYRKTITGTVERTMWYGKRSSELVLRDSDVEVEYRIEISDIANWETKEKD